MASSALLTYNAPWYRIGDADETWLALAYGAVAMCTVWVFESLITNLLFSADLHISIAEAAALFTFKGAGWFDIFRWTVRGRGLRRNRRAHLAILLRTFITAIDVLIIVCAVPREIPVFEKDTGTPQINFQRRGNPLFRSPNSTMLEFNACIWDKTLFEEFTAKAVVLVCSTQNSFEDTTFVPDNVTRASDMSFMVTHSKKMERLVFKSMSDNAVFFIAHNLFLPSNNVRPATTYNLPLPSDVAAQAVKALSKDSEFSKKCRRARPPPGNTEPGELFICDRRVVPNSNELREKVIIATMLNVYTERVDASKRNFRKVKAGGMEEVDTTGPGRVVGMVNRPLLCIYPALILFTSLLILDILVKFRLGSGNIIMKLYRLAVEAIGDEGNINPLYANDRKLMFQGDKTTYRDFDRSKGGGYLVGNWQNERLPGHYDSEDPGYRDAPIEYSESLR